jgi:uncharacterized radical SAM superfamily Fe-S cluster-containing enzyme
MTPSAEHARWAKSVFVDLTTRCNLNCGLCFAQANQPQAAFEPTADELTAALAPIEGQPTMCLCGGEPTLREDLPQVIRTLKAHGSATKLFTNGIELTDPAKMRALAEAGLDWLCLQYDGPDPDVCRRFRGRDLTEVRAQALALARQLGLKVMLPCALKRNGNLSHVWRVIDAGLSDPAVMHVGIAACSLIGRHGEEDAAARVTIGETLAAIEAQSGGRLTARDFLAFRTLAYWLHRLTGHSGFFQRNCFFQTLLFRCRDGYWPATRFLDPRFAAARPADAARLLAAFAAVWRWDRIARDPRLKLITVERFHDELLLNLDELTHCNKCYLTPAGFLPMCAYNRRRERLAGSPPEQT